MTPTWIVDPVTGCHIWQGARIAGYPVLTRDGKQQSARRWIAGPLQRGEVVRLTCGNPACVNPAHFTIAQTARRAGWGSTRREGRGLIAADGLPAKRSYVIEAATGCHLWQGRLRHGRPEATWRGRAVNVRGLIVGAPKGGHVESICGNPICVKPSHLLRKEPLREQLPRERARAALAAGPDAPRNLAAARADAVRLILGALDRPHPELRQATWRTALRWAAGETMAALAAEAGVTPWAISQRIQTVDRHLRRQEYEHRRDHALRPRRSSATMEARGGAGRPEGQEKNEAMRTYRVTVPAIIEVRTPQTWQPKRLAREINETIVVQRNGPAKFRPSDVLKVIVGEVREEDVIDVSDDLRV